MKIQRILIFAVLSLSLVMTSLPVSSDVFAAGIGQASFTTRWRDPVGAEVNEVRNAVAASYNDSGTITAVNCLQNRWWLSETGWVEQSNNIQCNNNGSNGDSSTYEVYYNNPFCGNTWTNYDRNHVMATSTGVSGWVSSTWASGNCSSWLWSDTLFEPGVYH